MKRFCVLGVLKTELGLKIKEEMLSWLEPLYNVTLVEANPPNNVVFEYPFLKKACEVAIENKQSVLYLHTKGAAMPNPTQALVRNLWRHEFSRQADVYFDTTEYFFKDPTAMSPFSSIMKSICWFNGFVMNYMAAKQVDEVLKVDLDRYWYEQQMLSEAKVKCIGLYSAACNTPEIAFTTFIKMLH